MKSSSGISPSFLGLSRSPGWVTHVLLTRSRLCPRASPGSSLHLHVLSTPPAFVLSQDQTLRESLAWFQRSPRAIARAAAQAWLAVRLRRPVPLSDHGKLSSLVSSRVHLRVCST